MIQIEIRVALKLEVLRFHEDRTVANNEEENSIVSSTKLLNTFVRATLRYNKSSYNIIGAILLRFSRRLVHEVEPTGAKK